MTFLCSQNHANPAGSRFCHICGEALSPQPTQPQSQSQPTVAPLTQGIVVGNNLTGTIGLRYRILRELGHGGFGRTYLAEDINRFNEPCVLKEFAPQVQGTSAIQKASELFEREAGVLYKLQHPQVPRFRELLRVQLPTGSKLFLVQDFVAGRTYYDLLNDRRQRGQTFSEGEIVQLLRQLLPVLDYIHTLGVVHRDVSPDNLMQRDADRLPVLIDFGGVKQLAATVASQLVSDPNMTPVGTRLGKVGYAPEEQLRLGVAYPHSDLYALAVTMLVLLTGREPQDLLNANTLEWEWRHYLNLSPGLANVLDRMLARQANDRFQSARQVLQALDQVAPQASPSASGSAPTITYGSASNTPGFAPPPVSTPQPTQPPYSQSPYPSQPPSQTPSQPAYTPQPSTIPPITTSPSEDRAGASGFWGFLVGGILIFLMGLGGLIFGNRWIQSQRPTSTPTNSPTPPPPVAPTPTSQFSPVEQARKQALDERRDRLGVSNAFLVQLTNREFYARNPNLNDRELTADPADEGLRTQWDQLGEELLTKLEGVDPAALSRLGNYGKADLDRWLAATNKLNLSSRALYDLADAKFFRLFPEQQGQDFINQPIGQVWYAIVADRLQAIQNGKALETFQFKAGALDGQVSGELVPGEGKAYIASFHPGQIVRLNWQASDSAQISFYPPTSKDPAILEDTKEKAWSGKLEKKGFYEIVIVSHAAVPITYSIDLAADNITTPTTPTPSPTGSPSPIPETSP